MKTTDRGLQQWTWLQGSCLQFAYGDKDLNVNSFWHSLAFLQLKAMHRSQTDTRASNPHPDSATSNASCSHTHPVILRYDKQCSSGKPSLWTLPDWPSFMCCHNRRWWSPPSSQQKKFFWTGREVISVFAAGAIYMAYSGITGLHMSN